jgi:putative glutamine amidotransferase
VKPIIGITASTTPDAERYYQWKDYVAAIEASDGIPLLIPPLKLKENAESLLGQIQGLLLSGGADLDPKYYGAEPTGVRRIDPGKDFLEINLAKAALKADLSILGICRGCQVLNVAAGGTLSQHIQGLKHFQYAPQDYPTHTIKIEPDTKLSRILDASELRVNSFHHQAIKDLAPGFIVSARAPDGVIEGIESQNHRFVIGVQFHIEYLWMSNPRFKRLFTSFVENSGRPSPGPG